VSESSPPPGLEGSPPPGLDGSPPPGLEGSPPPGPESSPPPGLESGPRPGSETGARRGPERRRASAPRGRLIVISGPSGVGKDTVLKELFRLAPQLRYSVSYTTRAPRPGEVDGVDYSFVDDATFERMAQRDEFLEHARVHGQWKGTSAARVRASLERGEDIVLKIDVQGAAQLRPRVRDALFIFLLPPSLDELRRRLEDRATESGEGLELRWSNAQSELAEQDRYDFQVVNRDVHQAAREILGIIESRTAETEPETRRRGHGMEPETRAGA